MTFDINVRQTEADMPLIVWSLCSKPHIPESIKLNSSCCVLFYSCSEPVNKSHTHCWGSIISPHSLKLSSGPVPFFTAGTRAYMRLWYNLEHPRWNLLPKEKGNFKHSSISFQWQKCTYLNLTLQPSWVKHLWCAMLKLHNHEKQVIADHHVIWGNKFLFVHP